MLFIYISSKEKFLLYALQHYVYNIKSHCLKIMEYILAFLWMIVLSDVSYLSTIHLVLFKCHAIFYSEARFYCFSRKKARIIIKPHLHVTQNMSSTPLSKTNPFKWVKLKQSSLLHSTSLLFTDLFSGVTT